MTSERGSGGAIAFAERVLQLLDEARYTATYKYAVLLALMDLVLEHATRSGSPPDAVTTRQLADKVVEIYWPQTRPFHDQRSTPMLVQNVRGQAEVLTEIVAFRKRWSLDPAMPLWEARRANPSAFRRLVDRIEWKLIEMPLPRLQVLGTGRSEFIYTIGWDAGVRAADVRRYQQTQQGPFDNRILLRPAVGGYLRQLNGLLRPLIQRQWTAMVARLNDHDDSRLEEFLFGVDRVMTGRVRHAIWDLQQGRCFYCEARTSVDSAELDHFIPWSRYPDNGLDNLVLADERCNAHKRAFLAAAPHVAKWAPRFFDDSPDAARLDAIASGVGWERHRHRTRSVARAIYLDLRPATKLWLRARDFVDADPSELSPLLT